MWDISDAYIFSIRKTYTCRISTFWTLHVYILGWISIQEKGNFRYNIYDMYNISNNGDDTEPPKYDWVASINNDMLYACIENSLFSYRNVEIQHNTWTLRVWRPPWRPRTDPAGPRSQCAPRPARLDWRLTIHDRRFSHSDHSPQTHIARVARESLV